MSCIRSSGGAGRRSLCAWNSRWRYQTRPSRSSRITESIVRFETGSSTESAAVTRTSVRRSPMKGRRLWPWRSKSTLSGRSVSTKDACLSGRARRSSHGQGTGQVRSGSSRAAAAARAMAARTCSAVREGKSFRMLWVLGAVGQIGQHRPQQDPRPAKDGLAATSRGIAHEVGREVHSKGPAPARPARSRKRAAPCSRTIISRPASCTGWLVWCRRASTSAAAKASSLRPRAAPGPRSAGAARRRSRGGCGSPPARRRTRDAPRP